MLARPLLLNQFNIYRLKALAVLLIFPLWAMAKQPETTYSNSSTSFAVYGDMPYQVKLADGRTDEQLLLDDIAPLIRSREDIAFVINVGDLGRPEQACSDAWLLKTKDFWQHELLKPVFYTPGDNEWADCDRKSLTVQAKELDRLNAIRRIFFSQPKKLSPQWHYQAQRQLPENATWQYQGIRFISLNLVSNSDGEQTQAKLRSKFNQTWLEHGFALAKKTATLAVVIATQVDVFGEPDGINNDFSRCLNNPAFKGFCVQIQALAGKLAKPVLLIHGDTNAYCLDQPFPKQQSANLWRLNAPGDYQVLDVALVNFAASNADQPFSVTGLLSGQPASGVCDYTRH